MMMMLLPRLLLLLPPTHMPEHASDTIALRAAS
jgi:hypothetical protein